MAICINIRATRLLIVLTELFQNLKGWKDEGRNQTIDTYTEGGLKNVWKAIQTIISPDPKIPEIIKNSTNSMINTNHGRNNSIKIINNYYYNYNCNHTPLG
uniref:Uncharacterized protein n=1 Tax=Schizaphis graminum TaxID=13262 RepID=A0A2S2NCS6_SCHGA